MFCDYGIWRLWYSMPFAYTPFVLVKNKGENGGIFENYLVYNLDKQFQIYL
jgi:hypothetical protein